MMKKTLTLLFTLLSCFAFAQVPQGISYQAVAFDSGGSPVSNGNVGVRISILDNSAAGTAVYSETHTEATNAQGLFNLNIGQGSATTGNFSTINWGVNSKFLKVEVDPLGSTNYTNVGTNQLMSVPYALYAEKSNQSGILDINSEIVGAKSANFAFIDSSDQKMYVFNSETNLWTSQSYSSISGSIKEANGNFLFIDSSDNKVYVFNAKSGEWSEQQYSSISGSIQVDTVRGNFLFIDSSDNKVYVFNAEFDTWSEQSYSSISGSIRQSKSNFLLIDGSDNKIYVFNSSTDTWTSQAYSSVSGTIKEANGNFLFIDSSDKKIYAFNAKTGTWSDQTYSSVSGSIKISKIE